MEVKKSRVMQIVGVVRRQLCLPNRFLKGPVSRVRELAGVVDTKPVLEQPRPPRTQTWAPKPVNWLALAFRMVNVNVVGNCWPPLTDVW